jgi:peptidoglycan hydrolase-like protein with peptidoglycan-binding domain
MNSPSYNIGDSFRNNTLQEGKFIGNNFSWTPQTQDVGTHSLTVTGVDGSNTSTATLTITVIPHEAPSAPAPTTPSAAPVAAPVVAPVFTLALHLGSSGSQVTALQKLLTKLHFYSSPITGYYGPLTVKAVSAFQKANKISALGTVGPATRAALNKK